MALPTRPIRIVLLLTLTLALLGSPAITLAQPTAAVAAPSAIGTAVVRHDAVTSDFPTGLTFQFDITARQPIARIDLLYRASNETTLTLAEPTFTPAADVAAAQTVDLQTAGVPPGIVLRYHWHIVEQNGAVTDTPEQSVDWTDTRFAWTALSGPDVTVFADNGDRAFDQSVLDRAEQTIGTLKARFGATPNWPIRIWVYNDKADFEGALAPNSEPWIAGAAFPWYGLILAILPDGDASEVARIIPHEMSHQVMFAATQNPFAPPPKWLDEGMAVYNQVGGKDQFPALVKRALAQHALPSLRSLNGAFPYDTQGALLAYAESLSVVTFIINRWGQHGVANLIAAFHEGMTPDDATKQALGVDLDQLDAQWRAWVGAQPTGG